LKIRDPDRRKGDMMCIYLDMGMKGRAGEGSETHALSMIRYLGRNLFNF
jgi:hypothetical protein